ncbi:hypothetical protein [Paenibacillus sp. MMS20-IR301]|uniref:hypothetical protein n=1 Tax=Paenibacillus sp. MMS20-IR301 TaxID=2895946 RepID=UPI0028E257A5|nr:hypothetical protein [Paenibacillus sp. MMS20-IR301]WNS46869.1 hypothetical protein LOS79_08320 [Paenibacillus sp. MMS20-IR301]
MDFRLPDQSALPSGFNYPESLLKVVRLNLIDLDPWVIMNNEQVISRIKGLQERYPDRTLIPFARRWDNDDIACFEPLNGERVQLIHDYASPGYEQRKEYAGFWDWFRDAVNEMIELD